MELGIKIKKSNWGLIPPGNDGVTVIENGRIKLHRDLKPKMGSAFKSTVGVCHSYWMVCEWRLTSGCKPYCLWHRTYFCCVCVPLLSPSSLSHDWIIMASSQSAYVYFLQIVIVVLVSDTRLELCLKHHQVVKCGKGLLRACTLPLPLLEQDIESHCNIST